MRVPHFGFWLLLSLTLEDLCVLGESEPGSHKGTDPGPDISLLFPSAHGIWGWDDWGVGDRGQFHQLAVSSDQGGHSGQQVLTGVARVFRTQSRDAHFC